MSAPPPQGFSSETRNGHGIGNGAVNGYAQPIAGPSNYARQGQPTSFPQPPQQFYAVNGFHQQTYPVQQPQHQLAAPYPHGIPLLPHGQSLYPAFDPAAAGVVPNYHFGAIPEGHWQDEWADDQHHDGPEMIYSNLEVKHRRRTTPDQLKILEYWYDINPKPDNALREHLAGQLGMTKRNVQVWFQNRRAKMKGLAKREEKATEGGELQPQPQQQLQQRTTPEKAHAAPPPPQRQMLLPQMGPTNTTRRASLANGEAAKIEMFVAKRAAAASGQSLCPSGYVSPQRSPLMGQASAARRSSIPYPTPVTAGPGGNLMSPKFSPVARVMPSALHLTAMRNNTRRASMPGASLLISSGPFTPPRVVTNQHQVGVVRETRELSPIKDHDGDNQVFLDSDTDFNTTYITPPSSTYNPSNLSPITFLPADSTPGYDPSLAFSPNSPLPNPSFSFGSSGMPAPMPILDEAEEARQQQLFFDFQQRGRMGSIASVNTYTTENGNGTDAEDANVPEWSLNPQELPNGFDPDLRRASAPADLLHQINLMGLNPNVNPAPIRPSPLGTHFTADSFDSAPMFNSGAYLTPTDMNGGGFGSSGPSPIPTGSLGSSEGPSPTRGHNNYLLHMTQQQQQQQHVQRTDSSSVSPFSPHLNSPTQNQNPQTYGQQAYQNAMYDGYQPSQSGIAHPPAQHHDGTQGRGQPVSETHPFDFNINGHGHGHGPGQGVSASASASSSGSRSGSGLGSGSSKDEISFSSDLGGSDAVNILV